jgi:hypothetical protein
MWLIEHTRWNSEEEYSYIKDVVDTYTNLINYFKVLQEKNPHLTMLYETIPRGTALKDILPILEGSDEHYCIVRYIATDIPTDN